MEFNQREGKGIVYAKGVRIIMLKTTETADLSSWEFMDSGPTTGETAWEQTGPSECE